jgi:hypothetical protein
VLDTQPPLFSFFQRDFFASDNLPIQRPIDEKIGKDNV